MNDTPATEETTQAPPEKLLDQLSTALEDGRVRGARRMLKSLNPGEIGNLLESLPQNERALVWKLVDPDDEGDVLVDVGDEVRAQLIADMDHGQLVNAVDGLAVDDLADIIDDLPVAVTDRVLRSMDEQRRATLEAVRAYDEDTAGGLMDTDIVTVRPDVTIDVVQRYLRLLGELPAGTDALFVTDRYNRFVGVLPLASVLTCDPSQIVADIMDSEAESLPADMPSDKVAIEFEHEDYLSAPVVNEAGMLVGRVTVDDVLDVIREAGEHSLLSMAGLDEDEDMFAPVAKSARRRAVWLGINLFTAFLASWVVGLFQGTIDQVVALAVLMPIVASMGGIAGSQTLTLVIRGQALGQISGANVRSLLNKELAVGAINSIAWSVLVAVVAYFWFNSTDLGLIIAVALITNMLFAVVAGISIPMILRKLDVDPALAGSVVLTTVTDVVGFFTFLGLGALFLV